MAFEPSIERRRYKNLDGDLMAVDISGFQDRALDKVNRLFDLLEEL